MYDERKVQERFSIILLKKVTGVTVVGYGHNDEMGSFILQGAIDLFPKQKLKEKVMSSETMRRLKMAKFSFNKTYVS